MAFAKQAPWKNAGSAGRITTEQRWRFEKRLAEVFAQRKLGVKIRNGISTFARAPMDRELRLIRRGHWAVPIHP
jgi:hypothetical protein